MRSDIWSSSVYRYIDDEATDNLDLHTMISEGDGISPWGQYLILPEILASFGDVGAIWLPFPDPLLVAALKDQGHAVITEPPQSDIDWPKADGLYFGTPTFDNGKPIFADEEDSGVFGIDTLMAEKAMVGALVKHAEASRYSRIVCGLGSGDVEPTERLRQLGDGARIVCLKHFDFFTDYVMRRDLG